jgi:hypothetical protein
LKNNKPVLILFPELSELDILINDSIEFLISEEIRTLNVAGPRASEWQKASFFASVIIQGILNKLKTQQ